MMRKSIVMERVENMINNMEKKTNQTNKYKNKT